MYTFEKDGIVPARDPGRLYAKAHNSHIGTYPKAILPQATLTDQVYPSATLFY